MNLLSDNNEEALESEDDIPKTGEVIDNNFEEAAADENDDGLNSTAKPLKPKKIVRNPQPKLNEDILKGPKGLLALQPHFEQVKLKGKGYEEEDLSVILKTYEYWCHRLFPKLPFDDCIERIEKLGHKKPIKAFITRIRMDLLVEESEMNLENEDDIQVERDFSGQITDEVPPQITREMEEREVSPQITREMEERIKQNKERAEKLRRERLLQRQNVELSQTFVSQD